MDINTIYDDIFRTIAQKMPVLMIALINEAFGTDYSDEVNLTPIRNEYIEKNGKIITDSIYRVDERIFHLECQSNPDGTMAIRMFEYDIAIALEQAKKDGIKYIVNMPESCVLYLRHNKNTPDKHTVEVRFPNNQVAEYEAKVIRAQEYTKDEIFQKKLLILLPYYLMRYEKRFSDINENENELKELLEEYSEIRIKLLEHFPAGEKSDICDNLISLICQMSDYLTEKYSKVKKGIGDIMGGKILMLPSDYRAEGRAEERIRNITEMISRGGTDEDLKRFLNASDEEIVKAKQMLASV